MSDENEVLKKLGEVHNDVLLLHKDIKAMQSATLNIMTDMQLKQQEANKEAIRANDLRDRQVLVLDKQAALLDKNTELLDKVLLKAITALSDVKTKQMENSSPKSELEKAKPFLLIFAGVLLFLLILFKIIDVNKLIDKQLANKVIVEEVQK